MKVITRTNGDSYFVEATTTELCTIAGEWLPVPNTDGRGSHIPIGSEILIGPSSAKGRIPAPVKHTERGFAVHHFTDHYGKECSLQKSSAAIQECVWLGCNDIGLKCFYPGIGWKDIDLPETGDGIAYVANTRMHLTQAQVAALLPLLTKFAETGELE